MNILECIKSAFRSVLSNKMRSFLTMLGIIIGISSVIMITSIGQGSQSAITGEFDKIGAKMLTVNINSNKAAESPRNFYLKDSDIEVLKKHPSVENISGLYQYFAKIKLRNPKETKDSMLFGINASYRFILNPEIIYGRFLTESDIINKSKVCVIDNILAYKIFGRDNVIGDKISLVTWRGTTKYTVVGVIKDPNAAFASILGDQMPAFIYLPISTAQALTGSMSYDAIYLTVNSLKNVDTIALELKQMLNRKNKAEDVYYLENAAKNLEQLNYILGIFTAFISFVAGISLLVGGIGVMNIMLVTVTERTREIGIRKSLGAKNKDIRLQFMVEALIITFIGGIIGMLLGYLGGLAIGKQLMNIVPQMSAKVIIITVSISTIIGLVFGVYPASKAAKLDPIEALRYE